MRPWYIPPLDNSHSERMNSPANRLLRTNRIAEFKHWREEQLRKTRQCLPKRKSRKASK